MYFVCFAPAICGKSCDPAHPASDATSTPCNIHWKPSITCSLKDALEIGLICATICTLPIRKICEIYSTQKKKKPPNFFVRKMTNFLKNKIKSCPRWIVVISAVSPKNMQKQDELARLRLIMHITGESAHSACM
jgi:hypothetical protein